MQNSAQKADIIYDRDYEGSTELRGEVVPFFQENHKCKGNGLEERDIAGDISGSELTSSEGQKGEVLSMELSLKVEKKTPTRDHGMNKLFTPFLLRLQGSL